MEVHFGSFSTRPEAEDLVSDTVAKLRGLSSSLQSQLTEEDYTKVHSAHQQCRTLLLDLLSQQRGPGDYKLHIRVAELEREFKALSLSRAMDQDRILSLEEELLQLKQLLRKNVSSLALGLPVAVAPGLTGVVPQRKLQLLGDLAYKLERVIRWRLRLGRRDRYSYNELLTFRTQLGASEQAALNTFNQQIGLQGWTPLQLQFVLGELKKERFPTAHSVGSELSTSGSDLKRMALEVLDPDLAADVDRLVDTVLTLEPRLAPLQGP